MLTDSSKLRKDLHVVIRDKEQLAQDWTSPIYAFFNPHPLIEVINSRRCHEFVCTAPQCKGKGAKPQIVCRFLDTMDAKSTGNLRKHAKLCWGTDIIDKADDAKDIASIRKGLATAQKTRDGSITASFERIGKGKVTYMTRQHTYKETR
jgi:hypothetical protein